MMGRSDIRDFIQNLLISKGDSRPVADHDSLLLSGRLQSIDAVEIVLFLEEHFAIDFAKIGFDEEQIDSINAIYALIEPAGSA